MNFMKQGIFLLFTYIEHTSSTDCAYRWGGKWSVKLQIFKIITADFMTMEKFLSERLNFASTRLGSRETHFEMYPSRKLADWPNCQADSFTNLLKD